MDGKASTKYLVVEWHYTENQHNERPSNWEILLESGPGYLFLDLLTGQEMAVD